MNASNKVTSDLHYSQTNEARVKKATCHGMSTIISRDESVNEGLMTTRHHISYLLTGSV